MAGTGSSKQVDPIAYRVEEQGPITENTKVWGFEPDKLKNADVNISAYGDDSSEKNYNNPDLRGGENDKYTGENTRNTSVAYNKDATIEGLNPNYAYGQKAQMVNSGDAGYIQRRNDEIASALYNAGKTSEADVRAYLEQQEGFMNSTANERENTIKSVWKRLGKISSDQSNNENKNDGNTGVDNNATKNMENDLNKDRSGEIYGKTTADWRGEDRGIKTLADANSVEAKINENRINNFKSLQSMDSMSIAASIVSGYTPYGDQGMRDLMQYDPQKYNEVQAKIKELKTQKNIDSITTGGTVDATSTTSSVSDSINNEISDFAFDNATSASEVGSILSDVSSSLKSNQNANTASETMASIESDIATLQNRMKNLDKEARSVFKSDVPQYIVNAYKANRQQEIQNQIDILTSRYNMAASRYQNEWNNYKWQAEYSLKERQLDMQEKQMQLNTIFEKEKIDLSYAELYAKYGDNASTSVKGTTVQTTTKTREEISLTVDDLIEGCTNGTLGKAQCAEGIQKNYLPYLGVDLGTLSKYSEKQGICNELAGNYTPQKGDLIVMPSSSKPENGHIGIVTGIDGDTITYLDWNGSVKDGVGTETAAVRTKKLTDSNIYGYYNPTKANTTSNGGELGYNENFADIYSKFLQGEFYTEGRLKTAISSIGGASVEDLRREAEAWKNAQKSNEAALMMLNAVEYLMSQGASKLQRQLAVNDGSTLWGIGDVAGGIDRLFSGDAANYNSYYHYIKDNMTLDHLVELKNNGATFGALSNQELSAIGNAALAMSSDMGSDEFNTQLFTIYNKLRKNVGERTLTKEEFDKMISAEDDSKKNDRGNYLVLYRPEVMSEEVMEELPEENL